MLAYICAASPSNSRPQPIANKVSPVKAIFGVGQMERDMAGGVGGDVDQLGLDRADPRAVAAGDHPVELRHPLGFGRAGDRAAGGGADRVVAAGMVRMPVGVPDLADRPAARRRRLQHRLGDRRIDRDRLARNIDRGSARHNCRGGPERGRSRASPQNYALPPSSASASRPSRSVSARGGLGPAEAPPPGRPTSACSPSGATATRGEREGRRFGANRAEPLGERARQAAAEAAAVEIGEPAMLGRLAGQAFAMRGRNRSFPGNGDRRCRSGPPRRRASAPPRFRARRRSRRPRSPAGRSRRRSAAPTRPGPSALPAPRRGSARHGRPPPSPAR